MANEQPHVLEDARDIAVVGHPEPDRYVVAVKPSLAFMRRAFARSVADSEDRGVSAFDTHWQFDEEKGITGSSTYLALRLDKRVLRPLGLWVPGLPETRVLEEQGKLENGVYRDVSIAVMTAGEPNKTHAQTLTTFADELGLELPLVVPFRALDYKIEGTKVNLSFVQSPRGIISGSDAVKQINSLNRQGDSGVFRLSRGWDGSWYADGGNLPNSVALGRVGDWVCGEATTQNLMQAYDALSERKYGAEITRLRETQSVERAKFEEALSH